MSGDEAEAYRYLIADVEELAGLSRERHQRLAARHGQSVARWHVLAVIAQEPATVPGIASRLGLTRQSVQRVVDDLSRELLTEKVRNPRHRSSPLVAPTDAGRRLLANLAADAEDEHLALLATGGVQRRELLAARQTIRSLLALLRMEDSDARP